MKPAHVLCCCFAIKEANFLLNCNSSFIAIFYSRRRHCKYDWLELVWIWLAALTQSHKYDWLQLDKIWLAAAAAWWRRLRGLISNHWLSPYIAYYRSFSKLYSSRVQCRQEMFLKSINRFTCVHSELELSGRCALQIYLLTYLLTVKLLVNYAKYNIIGKQ